MSCILWGLRVRAWLPFGNAHAWCSTYLHQQHYLYWHRGSFPKRVTSVGGNSHLQLFTGFIRASSAEWWPLLRKLFLKPCFTPHHLFIKVNQCRSSYGPFLAGTLFWQLGYRYVIVTVVVSISGDDMQRTAPIMTDHNLWWTWKLLFLGALIALQLMFRSRPIHFQPLWTGLRLFWPRTQPNVSIYIYMHRRNIEARTLCHRSHNVK